MRSTIVPRQYLVCLLASLQTCRSIAAETLYDAIIVGGGGGGCPLAQTLIEKGKHVLLLERGREPNSNSRQKETGFSVLLDNDCIEVFDGKGVVLAVGNCLGGATTFNQAIWIEELPNFLSELGPLFSAEKVEEAYAWVRNQIAPVQRARAGSPREIHLEELIRGMNRGTGIPIANVTPGIFRVQLDGIWRTHSIFQPDTNIRKSAETLLDRNNPLLDLKLESEVKRIVFEKDTARCVKMKKGDVEQYCIRKGGRIYLSAGAIHTPRLLTESGIGPGGHIYNNTQVGKNLSDKAVFVLTSFFKPGFIFDDGLGSFSEIAYTGTEQLSSGNSRLGLAEDLAAAKDGDLVKFARFERILLPRSLRFSFLNSLLDVVLAFCDNQIVNDGTLKSLCLAFLPFYDNGCTANAHGLAVFLADPSSTGEVRVNFDGSISVDPGYLSTEDDTEGLGAIIRTAEKVLPARTGPSVAAQPGDSCVDFYGLLQNLVAAFTFSFNIFGYASAQVNPSWLTPNLAKKTDLEIGEKAKAWIISPHHFAGTASIGRVVDDHFKVMGVKGLYVVDASVVPKTPRVNMMATAMMIGRLAGLDFNER